MTAASTPKGERRRQALVEAAAELLVEGGFDAVRHRAVAERAGLPLSSTTYYFDSLDELVAAAVEHHGRGELVRGAALLAALPTRPRGVDSLIDLVLDQLLGPPAGERDAELVLLRYERLVATFRRPYLRPLMHALGQELRGLLLQVFSPLRHRRRRAPRRAPDRPRRRRRGQRADRDRPGPPGGRPPHAP